MSKRTNSICETETVPYLCHCGKTGVIIDVRHYDRYILPCGHPVWALRSKRFGRLEFIRWPGPALTREEMRQKYPEEFAKKQS